LGAHAQCPQRLSGGFPEAPCRAKAVESAHEGLVTAGTLFGLGFEHYPWERMAFSKRLKPTLREGTGVQSCLCAAPRMLAL
jgi:hypothetical protein